MKTTVFTIWIHRLGHQKSTDFLSKKQIKITSAIQTWFLVLRMTESIKKLSKMVSKGVPKMSQKSSKIHPGTFQGSFERICVPLDHQNGAKMVPRTSKLSQNGHPRALKGDKMNNIQWQIVLQKMYISNSAPLVSILKILQILLILAVSKSTVNWLPGGPAAGAKP